MKPLAIVFPLWSGLSEWQALGTRGQSEMNDIGRVALEAEAPVNPYSLLEAVNRSSGALNTAWIIFIALMSYLLIAVAGVSHRDLLLNNAIPLPILQVQIELTRFFLFAPIVLVLLHVGVLSQAVLLARKTLEFDRSLRMLETTDRRTHPLRLELDNFFFVQAIAGADRSRVMGSFLHGMSWLTLVFLPAILLLYIQTAFLPYHSVSITGAHRFAVLADIALLVFVGVFLVRTGNSFFRAFGLSSVQHPMSFVLTGVVLCLVAFVALFVATIPGEPLDRAARSLSPVPVVADQDDRAALGFLFPFVGTVPDRALLGLFRRNLDVTDADLVVDKDISPGEASLSLRNRDLRFARLDRTDLHQADFTGANLEGASFVQSDLRNVRMQCADLNALLLRDDRAAAGCTRARRADFSKARMSGARLSGIDLRAARLEEASLDGAELTYGLMYGANFAGAHLERADVTGGVWLQGANFLQAQLQGADLTGAKLQLADLSNTGLQGAVLALANLEGAGLRDSSLDGAYLPWARLEGADLNGARAPGADFRGAAVWQTTAPAAVASPLADFGEITLAKPSPADAAEFNQMVARIDSPRLRVQLIDGIGPLFDPAKSQDWTGSAAMIVWQDLIKTSETAVGGDYRQRITQMLSALMCKARWGDGAVATGIARRAQGSGFKGDMLAIYDRLRAQDCAAMPGLAASSVLRDLTLAADAARGQ